MNAIEARAAARERTAASAHRDLAAALQQQATTTNAGEWLAAKALIEMALTQLGQLGEDRRRALQLAIDTARAAQGRDGQ